MELNQRLPFKVGQLAESKSFQRGFRGAWFRCKIKDIGSRKGHLEYALEFYDFPDEKVAVTRLYQKPVGCREEKERHLMIRPSFPPVYLESQKLDITTVPEVVAVVDGIWQVGDLVDWWSDDCYWSGRIIDLLGDDKVEIKLLDPPLGEGQSYDALCTDLRPSLDWSPEHGWTVPISTEGGTRGNCARLIQPVNLVERTNNDTCKEGAPFECSTDSSIDSASFHCSEDSLPTPIVSSNPPRNMLKQLSDAGSYKEEVKTPDEVVSLEVGDGSMGKPSSSDSVSGPHGENVSAAAVKTTGRRDRYSYDPPPKKTRVSVNEYLNSSFSDTIESSILDLEELATRIKWLKRIHQFGLESANAMTPSWEFLEKRASFKHT